MTLRAVDLPPGDAGTLETLNQMGHLVREGIEREPRLHALAQRLAAGGRSTAERLTAVYDWLAASYRFKDDTRGYEHIRGVSDQLDQLQRDGVIAADCDDLAIMGAAILRAMGLASGFGVIAASVTGPYKHVFPCAFIDGKAIPMDAQERIPLGQLAPGAARTLFWELHA